MPALFHNGDSMDTELLILDENQVAYSNGYIQALKDICDIMNGCEWPEDLEMDLYDFMKDKGMKGELNKS